jgi:thiamine-phosphate pyrophosphorylase
MKPAAIRSCEVHVLTDRGLSRGRTTREIVEAAVAVGVRVVQLREKELQTRSFYEEGLRIREFLRHAGVTFIVNDRVDLAQALDADGVHLGPDDMPVAIARRILGPDKIIGLSIKTPEDLESPDCAYADYLGVGPIFSTSTKLDAAAPWGLEGLRQARKATALPIVAIGSITPENAQAVVEAGADAVAVVSAVVAVINPGEAAGALLRAVQAGRRTVAGR